jgi:ectoine hydroxylase-related dioxygenase (phytanoyl-CoA dioxygenase family)
MMPTLTVGQTDQFVERGYVSGLEVFSPSEMDGLRRGYRALCGFLEPGEDPGAIREWHMASRWLYDVCSAPALLDIVEGVLGPDFYMWGSQFFAKSPRSSSTVAWHQDGYYWPLEPLHESVTAWLAFEDVDEGNGAMQVIPGSHRAGLLQHRKHVSESVLTLELEDGTFSAVDAVSLNLASGQASFHHDSIVHGSPANASDRDRVGLTVRYSRAHVRCDLRRAPQFRAYPLRGQDQGTNPVGEIPITPFARLSPEMHIRSLDEDGEG